MDKTTVSEYGYTIVTAILAIAIIVFLVGSYFNISLNNSVGEFVPQYEQYDYLTNRAYAEYIQEANQ